MRGYPAAHWLRAQTPAASQTPAAWLGSAEVTMVEAAPAASPGTGAPDSAQQAAPEQPQATQMAIASASAQQTFDAMGAPPLGRGGSAAGGGGDSATSGRGTRAAARQNL